MVRSTIETRPTRDGRRWFWRHYRRWSDAKRAKAQLARRASYVSTYLDTQGPSVYGVYRGSEPLY